MKEKFDVVVIGGGPGGTPAAMHLAAKGKKVLLVEKSGKLGGACLFVGCIPSKIIKHAADEYDSLGKMLASRGLPSGNAGIFWDEIRKRMDRILSMRSGAAYQRILQIPNVKMIAGTARFLSAGAVQVEEEGGSMSSFSFDNAIIATGSLSAVPPFKGNAVREALTSEIFFDRETLPDSIVIIGGGPIGIELAQMLSKLKVKCTVVEIMETILYGAVEPEFIQELEKKLTAMNIDLYASSQVLAIDRSEGGFITTVSDAKGVRREITSERVLVAAGRKPNIDGLDLNAAGVRFDHRGIFVNEHLQTSTEGIYATGDVIHGPKFAHTATYEAHIAAMNILAGGGALKVDFSKNSWVLFSDPEIAAAGYTEAEARGNGYDVMTGTYEYRTDATAQINESPFGYLKLIADRKTLAVIGAHVFVQGASSIIGEAALIVSKKLTLHDIAGAIHPHPTLSEAFGLLAMNMIMGMKK
jgi:dihydrolipoamide dehydrogenase